MSVLRQRVLSLYRRILRTRRTWEGPTEEREYIFQEARQQFRANRDTPASEVEGKLLEGERRLEIAVHYHIPYPRLHHAKQYKQAGYMPVPKLEDGLESKLSSRDSDVTEKLAAALRRRQEKLAQRGSAQ